MTGPKAPNSETKKAYVKVPDNFATMTEAELDALAAATYKHLRNALGEGKAKEAKWDCHEFD